MTTDAHLQKTAILDFDHPTITTLIQERGWLSLDEYGRIGAAYGFVKDEVPFGYNASDDLPASVVLGDGLGQCNTKGNLLMALLRALGIACRFHGFTIHKDLQKGAIPAWLYPIAPGRILHSWVEVRHSDQWLPLEGFILDDAYLRALQRRFPEARAFCGFGAATPNLQAPPVTWCGRATYIQREGIADDFGVFDDPDAFYGVHGTNLKGMRRWLYVHLFRHLMNRTVARIRERPTTSAESVALLER
ncbi:MAG: transglutaminase-like domain-containing protein [Bacteroidota bacterium]